MYKTWNIGRPSSLNLKGLIKRLAEESELFKVTQPLVVVFRKETKTQFWPMMCFFHYIC